MGHCPAPSAYDPCQSGSQPLSFLLNLLTTSTLIDPPLCNAADRHRVQNMCSRLIIIPLLDFFTRNKRHSDLATRFSSRGPAHSSVVSSPLSDFSLLLCRFPKHLGVNVRIRALCVVWPPSLRLPRCIFLEQSVVRADFERSLKSLRWPYLDPYFFPPDSIPFLNVASGIRKLLPVFPPPLLHLVQLRLRFALELRRLCARGSDVRVVDHLPSLGILIGFLRSYIGRRPGLIAFITNANTNSLSGLHEVLLHWQ